MMHAYEEHEAECIMYHCHNTTKLSITQQAPVDLIIGQLCAVALLYFLDVQNR